MQQGIFLPESPFSADSLMVSPPHAIACIYICVSVKDPVIHVRVWWIMETLEHPAYTRGWVAQLCHSWLSLGKATWISHGRNSTGTIRLQKVSKKKKGKKKKRKGRKQKNCVKKTQILHSSQPKKTVTGFKWQKSYTPPNQRKQSLGSNVHRYCTPLNQRKHQRKLSLRD